MHSLAYLSAGTDQGVGIYHSAFIHIGPYIHIGRRHHHNTFRYVGTPAYAAPSRHKPESVGRAEISRRNGVLVHEISHLHKRSYSESLQNTLLDGSIDLPFAVYFLGHSYFALFKSITEE